MELFVNLFATLMVFVLLLFVWGMINKHFDISEGCNSFAGLLIGAVVVIFYHIIKNLKL